MDIAPLATPKRALVVESPRLLVAVADTPNSVLTCDSEIAPEEGNAMIKSF
jgi:hypothetical protein